MSRALANEADRRQFYRVDDNIVLTFRPVAENRVQELLKKISDEVLMDKFTIAASFAARQQEMKPLLLKISQQSPDVGAYLAEMQKQVSQLSQLFMLQEMDDNAELSQKVSLSAGGLAFYSSNPLPAQTKLELRLLLVSSCIGILTCGTVIRSDARTLKSGEQVFRVATEFTHIRESDRDMLVKHILNRESEMRRIRTTRTV